MPLACLLLFSLLQQPPSQPQPDAPLGTYSLGGVKVPIILPVGLAGPFAESREYVELGPYRWQARSDGSLGPRYLREGGWEDLATAYSSLKDQLEKAPAYKVEVIFHANSVILEKGADGTIRDRRSSIERYHMQDIYLAMGQFKALAEVAARGKMRIEFTAVIDDAPQIRFLEAGKTPQPESGIQTVLPDFLSGPRGGIFGTGFIAEAVAPRINGDAGSPVDRVTLGPFDSVIDFHAGLTPGITTALVGRVPVTTIPYWFFTDQLASEVLPDQLFAIWRSHLAIKAAAAGISNTESQLPASGSELLKVPRGFDFDLTDKEIDAALGKDVEAAPASPSADLASLGLHLDSDASAWLASGEDGSYLAVRRSALPLLQGKDLTFVGVADGGHGAWDTVRIYKAPAGATDAWSALGAKPVESPGRAATDAAPRRFQTEPVSQADWTAKPVDDGQGGKAWEITRLGLFTRGSISLARGRSLLAGHLSDELTFRVKSKSEENYALSFLDSHGKTIGALVFVGDAPLPAEVSATQMPPIHFPSATQSVSLNGEWQTVHFNLSHLAGAADVADIRLGSPPFGNYYPKVNGRLQTLTISDLAFGPASTASESGPPDTPLSELRKVIGTLSGPPTPEQAKALRAAMESSEANLKANAAAVFEQIVDPSFEPDLAKLAQGSSGDGAAFALRALEHQGTPASQEAIRQTLVKGLFDANRRFAADLLPAHVPESYLDGINMLQVSLFWTSRKACAQALAKTEGKQAPLFLLGLISDIDPSVRTEAVEHLDPNDDVAMRRLEYMSVNDPSEWVRATAYARLIEAKDPKTRASGMAGTRDDSDTVKMWIVMLLGQKATEEGRPALDAAIISKSQQVRSAVLDALAFLPNPTRDAEVQNVFDDTRIPVLRSLSRLARRSKMSLPAATLKAMSLSGDPELMQFAGGGSR